MTPFHVLIPARYGSTRLPAKPLLQIAGKPMLQHVVEAAGRSAALSVTVATDDPRIVDAVNEFGGTAIITSQTHQSGSDRIAEACARIGFDDHDLIVNVQGDEPQMPPQVIDQVAGLMADHPLASMATLCTPIDHPQQMLNPAVVKVVMKASGEAMYFSRAPIPWKRAGGSSTLVDDAYKSAMRHLGIYACSSGYIQNFASRQQAPIEQLEQLEQLRALWYGDIIACAQACSVPPAGIDDSHDLERVRAAFAIS